jgi:hypothetical protein
MIFFRLLLRFFINLAIFLMVVIFLTWATGMWEAGKDLVY